MSQRDDVRTRRATLLARANERGIDLTDLLVESRDPRILTTQILQLMGGAAPLPGRYRLELDHPPIGAIDGANKEFELRAQPLGNNLIVVHVRNAPGNATRIERTTSNSPAAGTYYWDGTTLITGEAPAALDSLLVFYLTKR